MPLKVYAQATLERARRLREAGRSWSMIGRMLGVRRDQVQRWAQQDWRTRKRWTPDDDRKLQDWSGSYAAFARRHGWSQRTVYRACHRLGIQSASRLPMDELTLAVQTGEWNIGRFCKPLRQIYVLQGRIRTLRNGWVFTTSEVAHLLGGMMSSNTVRRWIAEGLLVTTRTGNAKYSWHLITHDALVDALHHPATWRDWQPQDIADPDWREVAEAIRQEETSLCRAMHGRMHFTTVDVVRLLGGTMTRYIVRRWIAHGLVIATRTGDTKKSWYLITHDALLAALRNPATWPDWRVSDITDADWQAAAAEIREGT